MTRSKLRRIVKAAALLLLLGLLFMATAAPGGGGGGGYAGGGGFGGGGGSRSRDSYHGYNPYSPYDSRRHGYGGDPLSRAPLWVTLVMVGAGLAVAGLVVAAGRHRAVHLLLNLRQAERYAPALDRALAAADFDTPAGRAATRPRAAETTGCTTSAPVVAVATATTDAGRPTVMSVAPPGRSWRCQNGEFGIRER
jgi:hypothetical protein